MAEKMTKTDEAYLTGNMKRFWKLILRQARSGRTQLENILEFLAVADKKWPNEGVQEREKMRKECLKGIESCNNTELVALRELAGIKND